jgi:hypothetical protein
MLEALLNSAQLLYLISIDSLIDKPQRSPPSLLRSPGKTQPYPTTLEPTEKLETLIKTSQAVDRPDF